MPERPIAFRWGRYYTSADADRDGPMGRGFRHSYEQRLTIDLDRVVYTDARGRAVEIPPPVAAGRARRLARGVCARGSVTMARRRLRGVARGGADNGVHAPERARRGAAARAAASREARADLLV